MHNITTLQLIALIYFSTNLPVLFVYLLRWKKIGEDLSVKLLGVLIAILVGTIAIVACSNKFNKEN